ncbi:MAG: hypothetical protein ACYCWW_00655 [Deltaproteobacteria bacterium]
MTSSDLRWPLLSLLALAASSAAAFEPDSAPFHYDLRLQAGAGEPFGAPGSWSGACASCPAGSAPGSAVSPSSALLGEVGGGLGAVVGLFPFLSLRLGGDLTFGYGGARASPPVTAQGETFAFGPGPVWELVLDLPVDLRFRLGPLWELYLGVAPGFADLGAPPVAVTTTSGTSTASLQGSWVGLIWRAGIERFYSYRRSAIGLLAEGVAGGGAALYFTYAFQVGDSFDRLP